MYSSRGRPRPLVAEMDSTTRPALPLAGRGLHLVDELGQVLADGVVVETEMGGHLGDVGRAITVGDVAEDVVPGRITQRSRLLLQCRHVH